ncbi:hypothetical protein NIES2119_19675 [[Phormidium ambiguum] IAM M-71]|uniref:Uncharacterized protein n=1 Tax=[Phormidium ambiguum] IAM M-71 TaxID=454136 RepID=A0A1U7IFG3_9CYAN|nr:hypothetical protein [Phormidium ambiguum]OKH35717.1 hypothetical protein NIES2119_19675 [Phormidium ambiguum IAM M-71]
MEMLSQSFLWKKSLLFGAVQDRASQIINQSAQGSQFISESLDRLWDDVLGGGLYTALANLGILFAVGTLLIFIVQWAKDLIDGEEIRSFAELIWPILVICLLANNASLLSDATKGMRSLINQVNQTILTQTASSISLQEAYQKVMLEIGSEDLARGILAQCASKADPIQQQDCVNNAIEQAKASAPPNPSQSYQNFLDSLNPLQQGQNLVNTLQSGIQNTLVMSARGLLIAFGMAFQWLVEITWLLTALLGPLAVGGTLLPVGQRAIFAWLIGFYSVGLIKLSLNIVTGLVATLVVNAGDNDPMIFAFAVGLLAPILSLALAAGAGKAVFDALQTVIRHGLLAGGKDVRRGANAVGRVTSFVFSRILGR